MNFEANCEFSICCSSDSNLAKVALSRTLAVFVSSCDTFEKMDCSPSLIEQLSVLGQEAEALPLCKACWTIMTIDPSLVSTLIFLCAHLDIRL